MPRLSLFKPEKGNDFNFMDRNIAEMFQVGGTDAYIHKYLGPNDQGESSDATQPQSSGDTTVSTEVYNPDLLTDAGALSDSDAYNSATAVTNREYEQDRQDSLRKIRLLDPKYVSQFVDEFKSLMKESSI